MLAYAVGWLLFPVIMWQVSDALNCRQNYSRFIVAYNWSALLQHGLFIGSDLMMIGLGFPDSAKGLVLVIVLGYMLVYQWFVAKNALEVTSGIAVLIVAIDLLTSVLWETVSTGLASG